MDKVLKTDAKMRTYTGLPNKKTFNNLIKHVTQKSMKLRYWSGSKMLFQQGSQQLQGTAKKDRATEETKIENLGSSIS